MGRPRTSNIVRLMRLVQVDESTGCWVWQGSTKGGGYAQFSLWVGYAIPHRSVVAHRVAYELLVGPIPDGLELDHLCRNRLCVNPEHLEPVTASVNMQRAYAVKTTCPQGHSYEEHGYRRSRDGARCCRQCGRDATRRWREGRRRAEAAIAS